jgi:MFS family permease
MPDLKSEDARHDPYAALRIREYRLLAFGNFASNIGTQMLTVALSWELYRRTNSPTALGLVGLFQVIPLLLLSIPAGHLVDSFSRKHILQISQGLMAFSAISLALASLFHDRIPAVLPIRVVNHLLNWLALRLGEREPTFTDPYIPVMYALIFVNGMVRSASQPAKSALLPQLVPADTFSNAASWNSSINEICTMIGPTIAGGLLAAFSTTAWAYALVYGLNSVFQFTAMVLLLPITVTRPPRRAENISLKSLLAGVHFVWTTKLVLSAMTLDLFAVILGGATALLPIFAKDILHTGPAGLGWLRAAPAVGAFAMGLIGAHLPPTKHAGRNLALGVIGFGVATIAFGMSKNFMLSFAMLLLTGAFDNISVVIRSTLVQLRTPDHMRGRVSAVNSIFIGSSNQIGMLESGITAALFGSVASVVLGGVGTILVVITAILVWPELRRCGSLQPAMNEPADSLEAVDEAAAAS